jgi:hypothetical protein
VPAYASIGRFKLVFVQNFQKQIAMDIGLIRVFNFEIGFYAGVAEILEISRRNYLKI